METATAETESTAPGLQWMTTMIKVVSMLWVVPVALGVPGNLIAILVTTTTDNRKLSTCNYMTGIAVADLICPLSIAWGQMEGKNYFNTFYGEPSKRGLYIK